MIIANPEAEKSVIGAILLDATTIEPVAGLEPRDFYYLPHVLIWTAIKHLYQADKPIDLVTITEELHRYKRLDDIGGVMYLNELLSTTPTAANIGYYARIVRDYALKRRVHDIGQQISGLASKTYDDHETMFELQMFHVLISLSKPLTANTYYLVGKAEFDKPFTPISDGERVIVLLTPANGNAVFYSARPYGIDHKGFTLYLYCHKTFSTSSIQVQGLAYRTGYYGQLGFNL